MERHLTRWLWLAVVMWPELATALQSPRHIFASSKSLPRAFCEKAGPMSRVFLASYATERFESVRRELNDSAGRFGITDVLSYTKSDLQASDYYLQNVHYCQDRASVTDDPNVCGKNNLPEYVQHRHDQAILSVLAAKHRVETFRNPTVGGNFLKPPQYRVAGEAVPPPFAMVPDITTYASTPQLNSPYGTIVEINRLPNWSGKQPWPSTPAFRIPLGRANGRSASAARSCRRTIGSSGFD